MIQELEVPLSVFVVGQTLERFPTIVDRLDAELETEFHLHSYQHDMTKSYEFSTEVKEGIRAYRNHFDTDPIGYRAPQGNITPKERIQLESAGFKFDASVFPSYRPGVYNNIRAPLTPYRPQETDELVEIPFGAVPYLRIPIAMNYLKLLGTPYLFLLKRVSLPSVLVFDSHLQDYWLTEFHTHLPNPKRSLMTRNIERATEMFRSFVGFMRAEGYEFRLISSVYEEATLT
jgi:peptidoglycan/xylan/chitin deacetylase (PgdA/CDA1 family)